MLSNQELILVAASDPQIGNLLDRVLRNAEYNVTLYQDWASTLRRASMAGASLVILAEKLTDGAGLDAAAEFARRVPGIPVILFASKESIELARRAMQCGVAEIIAPPMRTEDILRTVRSTLDLAKRRKDNLLLEARRYTSTLERQMDEMETLMRLSRQVAGSLELDSTLTAVVSAAVELTGAEEGSLLLLDEASGELYIRASRNFQEDLVRTFRLPVTDSIAGQVIRTGEPVLMDEGSPQKIMTSYLVQSLLYVPLSLHGHVFGVLGVDNRLNHLPLTQRHVKLLTTLAGFAAIAIDNARLYANTTTERNRLEAILSGIQDGVVVIGQDQRLSLVNKAARDAFAIDPARNLIGELFHDVFPQEEMQELAGIHTGSLSNRTEVSPAEDRVYSVMAAPLSGVGRVFTMHDITYLKKLDHIKTEFVSTVSHDLRSPLTAILGYVELIERAGPVTDLQKDFVRRIQVSVHNITGLMDNLLNLGRIESGFDVRKENVRMNQILQYAADGMKKQLSEKSIQLVTDFPEEFPALLANPIQMRQMIDHLLGNAVKYSGKGGVVSVKGAVEQDQVILQFTDHGIGIPPMDLPYIFDKFYRATNASVEMTGTGLGLAIVKSIIENHNGRIWVDSVQGKGSTFTVVLPMPVQG